MAKSVRAKKHLGQHFLTDLGIALDTADAFGSQGKFRKAIEIGPGMGVLTKPLLNREDIELFVIDIDTESIAFLKEESLLDDKHLIEGDFLQLDLNKIMEGEKFGIVGNFPYNISSQILFRALEYKDQVVELVGMFQKEVADRIASPEGSKVYGITSVLLQAYFDIEYLFTVDAAVFSPPPKVQSAVIRLRRNSTERLPCNEQLFKQVVKMAFNQRRKTLRNSLKALLPDSIKGQDLFDKRPEQLSVKSFIDLCLLLESSR